MHGTPTASPTSTLPPTVSPTVRPTTATEAASTATFGTATADNATLEPGIYITRIIREVDPDNKGAIKFSVWLAANGDYYVDSIRIVRFSGSSNADIGSDSGALYPDAN